jgi:hypothetical protein
MLTKERLAEKFKGLARLFPGIPSYQEREALRAQDKVIRTGMASRLDQQVQHLDRLKAELTDRGKLSRLAELDTVSRRLQRLADSIRFASYGYAGLFAHLPVDEKKLAELYDYDLSLGQALVELEGAIRTLIQPSETEWQTGPFQEVKNVVDRIDEKIAQRKSVFTGK